MKVLFITEKYHSGPTYGLTNSMLNLIGSYEDSGCGNYQHLFIDPEDIWSGQGVDYALLNNTYDIAIVSVYHHLPSREVAQIFGHKMCYLWWDGSVSLGGMLSWAPLVHQVCFDFGKGEEYPNVFCLEVPQDTRVFKRDKTIIENIDISFVGSIDAPRPDRKALIERIRNAGFNVWAGGGRGTGHSLLGNDNLPIEEYVRVMQRSKINLNLSYGHSRPQRKGRLFELGALGKFTFVNNCEMLANTKNNMDRFFEPELEYVSFDDNNILEKLSYYLEHEEERKQIADRFYDKYMNNYSPKHFWDKILNICGV